MQPTPSPLSKSRLALMAALLCAGTAGAADDTAAVIQDLKRRIAALEAQQAAQQAAASKPEAAPVVAAAPAGDFKFNWGGYVKLDAISSTFSDGAVAQGTGRDFYVPGAIPVSATPGARSYTDFLAKESRLFVKGDGTVAGHKTGVYVEFDFISSQGSGSESVTNAYNPALRRAYLTFDHWLFGQDWSTLQNLVALPDTLDFVAWPSEGTVFSRQPQIRYTLGAWQVALENPETTVHTRTLGATQGSATATNTDDNSVPDLVAKYTLKTDGRGEYSLAGVVRQLSDRATVGGASATTTGYGLSLAGKLPMIGQDDLRFTLSGGDGIGRYLALNTVGDAIVTPEGGLHSVEVINGFAAYRHPWNDQWRSNLVVSAYHANTGTTANGSTFGSGVSRNIRSAAINLLYSPIPKITFGAEYRHARRDTVEGLSGDLDRVQFSAKYAF